jgi:hypothetical protein
MDMQGLRKSTNDGAGATQLEACMEEDGGYETLADGSTSGSSNSTNDNNDCLRSNGYYNVPIHQNGTSFNESEKSLGNTRDCQTVPAKDILETHCKNKDVEPLVFCCSPLMATRPRQIATFLLVAVISFLTGIGVLYGIWMASRVTESVGRSNTTTVQGFHESTDASCKTSAVGWQFVGDLTTTILGYTCQAWAAQYPQLHTMTKDSMFPDGSVAEAANKCRNPDRYKGGPWCYTTNPAKRWDLCDVPFCPSRASTMVTKSGDYVAIAMDTRLFLTNDPNSAHNFLSVVPCLSNAVDIGCVSFRSAERSGWYVRHWDYDLWLESSVNPSNRDTFNVDGSFHIRRDKFCPGYFSFESVNYPNHFIVKDRNTTRGLYINPGHAADYNRSCFNFIEQ